MDNISSSHIINVTALNDWDWTSRILFFSFALPGYLLTIVLNATLIMIIVFEKALHEPMYIFLCNLCVNDLCGATGFYPRTLSYLLTETNRISLDECAVQGLVIVFYATGEFTNLSVMAVDRYVAICQPLHYHSIMSPFTVWSLVTFIWIFPCFVSVMAVSLALKYPFCKHSINKLFCEHLTLLNLACKQDIFQGIFNVFIYISMSAFFVFVLLSYLKIILACRKSKVNQEKFYSTCIPHLVSFLNTTCGLFDSVYTKLKVETLSNMTYTFLSVIILTIPPVVNPVVYGIKLGPIRAKILYIFQSSKINNL
ncbi:olfactory receptor 24-like [Labeo rohita]|uniref:olfactory receptor 24-like n=1 Tax=Labeo rohita TaxID=84645 RepID=UPI0021E29A65|nr:olfactory receptor 24-like [Labeo rohita]